MFKEDRSNHRMVVYSILVLLNLFAPGQSLLKLIKKVTLMVKKKKRQPSRLPFLFLSENQYTIN